MLTKILAKTILVLNVSYLFYYSRGFVFVFGRKRIEFISFLFFLIVASASFLIVARLKTFFRSFFISRYSYVNPFSVLRTMADRVCPLSRCTYCLCTNNNAIFSSLFSPSFILDAFDPFSGHAHNSNVYIIKISVVCCAESSRNARLSGIVSVPKSITEWRVPRS